MKTLEEKRAYQREYYHRKKNGKLPVPKNEEKKEYNVSASEDAKEKKREYQRAYYNENRMKILSYMKVYYKKVNADNPKRPYKQKPFNPRMVIFHYPIDQPKTIIFE